MCAPLAASLCQASTALSVCCSGSYWLASSSAALPTACLSSGQPKQPSPLQADACARCAEALVAAGALPLDQNQQGLTPEDLAAVASPIEPRQHLTTIAYAPSPAGGGMVALLSAQPQLLLSHVAPGKLQGQARASRAAPMSACLQVRASARRTHPQLAPPPAAARPSGSPRRSQTALASPQLPRPQPEVGETPSSVQRPSSCCEPPRRAT